MDLRHRASTPSFGAVARVPGQGTGTFFSTDPFPYFFILFILSFFFFQYLRVARCLKYYGYVQFAPCSCDYPQPGSRVLLALGDNELNLRLLSPDQEKDRDSEREIAFKVPRIRCWRVTATRSVGIAIENASLVFARAQPRSLVCVCIHVFRRRILVKISRNVVWNCLSST